MTIFLFATIAQGIIKFLLGAVAIFLILLVLVQRGRGGGLAGALGGMGGSSAFGAKAGDIFTRITIVAAAVWIVLCIVAAKMGPSEDSLLNTGGGQSATTTSGSDLLDIPAIGSGIDEADQSEAESESAEATEETPAADDESTDGDETGGNKTEGDEAP